jgi:type IV pilus assembly protein PilE
VDKRQLGMSLLEVLTVTAIIGVLATLAILVYRSQIVDARRTDATGYLWDLMQREEKVRNRYGSYTTQITGTATCSGAACGLNQSTTLTPEGHYGITAAACGSGLRTCVRLQADATAAGTSGKQAEDTACVTITLSSDGTKGPAACW